MQKETVYLTTTLPYVNADPHIGFALEIVHADMFARYQRLLGREVFFNTGTDEHGLKIYRNALEAGKDPQAYTDEYAGQFDRLREALNLSYTNFIRTTDPSHQAAAQAFWQRCLEKGDIYKKNYKVKYCVGCELEKTESELVEGKCPLHPKYELELIEEENYFFKFSKYQQPLLDLYEREPRLVVPEFRFNEIKSFVKNGLEDFSISRLREKMPWGVPVPGDESHVMYVWFDALVNYISAIGWPGDAESFGRWWPVIQFAGKDNLRQQSAMWQAMLMSAGIIHSQQIVIHGFITSEGQKMSKSLGNVINPLDMVEQYGTEALRYYLVRHIHPFEDSDFSRAQFIEVYNANLANGLGNLAARILKMAETHLEVPAPLTEHALPDEYIEAFENYQFQKVADVVWREIGKLDAYIQETQPFKLIKISREPAVDILHELVDKLNRIADMLVPILPETADTLHRAIRANQKPENMFGRIEVETK